MSRDTSFRTMLSMVCQRASVPIAIPIRSTEASVLRTTAGKTLSFLALFVVVSLGAILLDTHGLLNPIKRPLEAVISPIASRFNDVAGGPNISQSDQVAQLTAERDHYRAEAMRLQNAENENTQLREQLGIEQKFNDFDVLSAGVVARDPSNSDKFITIDKGSDDGIATGMAVVDPNNYVGQVTQVGPKQSRVTLMIDSQAAPVSVQIVNGGDGIMYGMWQSGGRAEMRYVDYDAKPNPGDYVLTSSDSATQSRGVPGGLLVGQVGDGVKSDALTDELTVPIIPAANFERLRVVTVMTGPKPNTNATSVTPPASIVGTPTASPKPLPTDRPSGRQPNVPASSARPTPTATVDTGTGGNHPDNTSPSEPGGPSGTDNGPPPTDIPAPVGEGATHGR